MKITEAKKLSPQERFLYWIRERHQIYLRRKAGLPKPWTDDEILQSIFFTNPYRENDKTTVWFRENIRGPLQNNAKVLFATVAFRWFNYIPTGHALLRANLLENWDAAKCKRLLHSMQAKGDQIFTGAFMIPAVPGTNKIEHVCECLKPIWRDRKELAEKILGGQTMENAHSLLTDYPWLGGFMAYEVVCDLRYTYLLRDAPDKMTWCNPGPGCARGLLRLNGVSLAGKPAAHGCRPPTDWQQQIVKLLATVRKALPKMPTFELREIEHSLCEWDKFERAMWGDGKLKRKYNGV